MTKVDAKFAMMDGDKVEAGEGEDHDTYYFDPRLGADAIIAKMLDGFAGRVEPLLTDRRAHV